MWHRKFVCIVLALCRLQASLSNNVALKNVPHRIFLNVLEHFSSYTTIKERVNNWYYKFSTHQLILFILNTYFYKNSDKYTLVKIQVFITTFIVSVRAFIKFRVKLCLECIRYIRLKTTFSLNKGLKYVIRQNGGLGLAIQEINTLCSDEGLAYIS